MGMRWNFFWLVGLLLLGAATGYAGDSGRRYDAKGAYDGTYRQDDSGTYRLYDEYGAFEGTVRPDKDKPYGRRYSWDNAFEGTVEGDTEDE